MHLAVCGRNAALSLPHIVGDEGFPQVLSFGYTNRAISACHVAVKTVRRD